MNKGSTYLLMCLFITGIFGCTADQPDVLETADSSSTDVWIVFSSGRSGDGDIYAINPETSEIVQVAGTDFPEGTVRYDAHLDRIVYHRYQEEPARAMLVSEEEDLFVDPNGDVAPSWSPREGRIVYAASKNGHVDLYMAAATGEDEQRLTDDDFAEGYPAWSPDGSEIVYAKRLETGWDLHIMKPFEEGMPVKRLTYDGVYVGHPAWSPDGTRIAYDTLIDDQAEIMMIELGSSEVTRLTNRAGNDLIPAWSPDGNQIAFGGEPNNAGNWDLWIVDIESLEVTRLTSQPTFDGGPVFVPASAIKSEIRTSAP